MSDRKEEWLEELMRLADGDARKRTAKQARILEAAIDIFAAKGYAAASTSEIAQKAGVAEGTIFRHYKTKKELLLSIAGPIAVKLVAPFLMRDFAKLLELPYEKVDDFFRAVLKDRLQFARQNMKLIRILVHEIPFHPELLAQAKELFANIVLQRAQKVITHFQEKGQIIEAPPWIIIRTAISLFVGFVVSHLVLMPDEPFDEEQEIDRVIDLLMNGISPRP
ncbi:TetR/AcrR family transcriptional regulator [Paenibacillus nanensis]|uniref:TetR/AcrR family transcriptional regulator n=1 Tax=Paenibacillus nanensis TaxID=393251 RepID=A0A3A1V5T7_9BACL|nr:TetR/AcrR family transcriptional regulator [Paenibacillus nanensis]RIX54003.1 TetR/AcrR family transcriptional regulator [Paenibacillus nanensis]